MFKLKVIPLLLLLVGCATKNPTQVIEESERIRGQTVLVHLEHKRLVIYIKVEDHILLCHAYNDQNTSILKRVEQQILKSGNEITLYGHPVVADEEYLTGVDFIATTIELWHPVKEQNVIIDLNYGDRVRDAFSFKGLVKQTLKTATDKAVSAVK